MASLFTSLTLIPLAVARVLKVDLAERPRWQQWLIDRTSVPPTVSAGDVVMIGKYAGTEIDLDGEEHLILREDDVLAVIE